MEVTEPGLMGLPELVLVFENGINCTELLHYLTKDGVD